MVRLCRTLHIRLGLQALLLQMSVFLFTEALDKAPIALSLFQVPLIALQVDCPYLIAQYDLQFPFLYRRHNWIARKVPDLQVLHLRFCFCLSQYLIYYLGSY